MTNPQFYPLEINAKTKEPFLRLRKHKNIIMTAPRWEDAPYLAAIMNDPAVQQWMGPPYPYTLDHANEFIGLIKRQAEETYKILEDAKDEPTLKIVKRCPVSCFREVKEDGTDIFIGTHTTTRSAQGEFMGTDGVDWENKKKREEENDSLEVGDPRIIWSCGNYLAPSHHRQGIMSDAMDTVFHDWVVPRMNARHMLVSILEGNEGSVKVVLKNGFKLKATYKDHLELNGKMRGVHLFEWKYSETGDQSA